MILHMIYTHLMHTSQTWDLRLPFRDRNGGRAGLERAGREEVLTGSKVAARYASIWHYPPFQSASDSDETLLPRFRGNGTDLYMIFKSHIDLQPDLKISIFKLQIEHHDQRDEEVKRNDVKKIT